MNNLNNVKIMFPESSAVTKDHSRNSEVTEGERIVEEHLGFRILSL